MSMTVEQRRAAAFNKFFADHIEDLRDKYKNKNINPINEFVSIIESNDIEIDAQEIENVTQTMIDILNNPNTANYYQFESGRGGDDISFDLIEYMTENDEGNLYDDYEYIYFDEGSELFVCYRQTDSFVHMEVGLSEYVMNYVIELR